MLVSNTTLTTRFGGVNDRFSFSPARRFIRVAWAKPFVPSFIFFILNNRTGPQAILLQKPALTGSLGQTEELSAWGARTDELALAVYLERSGIDIHPVVGV